MTLEQREHLGKELLDGGGVDADFRGHGLRDTFRRAAGGGMVEHAVENALREVGADTGPGGGVL